MAPNETIGVNVRLSVWDLYRFQVGHALSRFWVILFIPGAIAFMVVFLFVTAKVGSTASENRAEQTTQLLTNLWPLLALFGFIFLVVPFLSAMSLRRNPNLVSGTKYTISADGVLCESSHARAEIKWSAFVKARESAWAFMLYPQNNMAHVIPKRGIEGPATAADLREILRTNVAKTKLRRA